MRRKNVFSFRNPIRCFTINSEGRKQTSEGFLLSYSPIEANRMDQQECINYLDFGFGNSGIYQDIEWGQCNKGYRINRN